MTELSALRQKVSDWLEEHRSSFGELCDELWSYSEPGLREYRSARALCDYLRAHGFEVEEGIAGMPTAFLGTYGSGEPVLATYAEYDASPGQSQKPVPYQEAVVPFAAGFTDAHHVLGVSACAAAIAAAKAKDHYNLPGTIKVFGTPGEKLCVGKPYMARDGYFDEVDAFLTWHPGHTTHNFNTTSLNRATGSSYHVIFTFRCRKPWEWSGIGGLSGVRHPGALEGVMLLYSLAKYMRDHLLPRHGGWTISEFIMTGGQATADNWPPDIAQIYYALRSHEIETQETIFQRLQECARAAARATFTDVEMRLVTKTRTGVPNATLGHLMYRNLEWVGPPRFSDEEKEFAREMMVNFGYEPLEQPFNEMLTPPEEVEQQMQSNLPPAQRHRGSDDSSEMGWHAPMGRLMVCGNALRTLPDRHYPIWMEGALCGTTSVHKMGVVAAKTIGCSMLELLTRPEELDKAKKEWQTRTNDRVLPPLLPEGLKPPINFRFPEWIDNRYPEEPIQDREWSIPPM